MKDKRQQKIIDLLKRKGEVKTTELLEELGVSIETIRRDYAELEKAGILKKSYGGAVLVSSYLRVTELEAWQKRNEMFAAQKELITRRAAEYIADGAVVATEVGTTMFELSKHLGEKNNLVVITNDLRVAQEAWRSPGNKVYLVGGQLGQMYYTSGYMAKEFLANFSLVDVFFFSADGVTYDGCTSIDAEINDFKRTLIKKAQKSIAVVDSSKFGKEAIFHTCRFDEVDLLVTDSGAPGDLIHKLKSQGVPIDLVYDDRPGNV